MSLKKSITGALAAGVAVSGLGAAAFAGEFDGVTVNILTRPGYVIAGRLAERGKEFEAATGGKIVVTEVPFAEIFPKIQNDWSTGTNSIDVGVFAAGWGVELDAAGLLEDMDPYIAKDTKLDLNDVAPYFREFGQKVGGKTKLLMVDGDFQMVYYRKDVLEKAGLQPPKTWEDYLDVASKIHGQDMNGDGQAGLRLLHLQEAQRPVLLRDPDRRRTHRADPGHSPGLPLRQRDDEADRSTTKAGRRPSSSTRRPASMVRRKSSTWTSATRAACSRPAVAACSSNGAIPARCSSIPMPTSVKGLILRRRRRGLQGSAGPRHGQARAGVEGKRSQRRRWHQLRAVRCFRRLGRCDQRQGRPEEEGCCLCLPLLHEPGGAIERRRDDRCHGLQPVSNSQLASTDLWVKAGMPADLAENYLGAINGALNNPNMASDMKIPGAQKYTGVVLDTELARYLAGEITVDEALKNIEAGWEEVTEDFGRDEQIKAQALALGTGS